MMLNRISAIVLRDFVAGGLSNNKPNAARADKSKRG